MHWGNDSSVGSEHSINGETYPMEMHFVHYSCNFTNISQAINDFESYNDTLDLAVVGIIFELSDQDNDYLNKILDYVDDIKYNHQQKTITDLNVRDMLDGFQNNSDFWFYEGSLTTPPCDPIVRWHVLEEKLTISESQLDAFRTLLDNDNRTIHQNWRPPSGDGSGSNENTVYEFVFNGTNTTEESSDSTTTDSGEPNDVTTTESGSGEMSSSATSTEESMESGAFSHKHGVFGNVVVSIVVGCVLFVVLIPRIMHMLI